MITLVANTVKKLLAKKAEGRFFRVMSDSTTVTRIAVDQVVLEDATGGFGITAYESVIVEVRNNEELFAVSTGTPNISIAEVTRAIPGEVIRV